MESKSKAVLKRTLKLGVRRGKASFHPFSQSVNQSAGKDLNVPVQSDPVQSHPVQYSTVQCSICVLNCVCGKKKCRRQCQGHIRWII